MAHYHVAKNTKVTLTACTWGTRDWAAVIKPARECLVFRQAQVSVFWVNYPTMGPSRPGAAQFSLLGERHNGAEATLRDFVNRVKRSHRCVFL